MSDGSLIVVELGRKLNLIEVTRDTPPRKA